MSVEFLTDGEAAVYGWYGGPPALADLDRVFLLDEEDLERAASARSVHFSAEEWGTTAQSLSA
ncbi:hypothetical protein [Streptosporangium roseum]|uniref:hypothetical protein n=1 Tax=Streptosporangium roseum TaxID=2001 RepID=UPI0004CD16C6|nr:hypothetical protein [Streptosporangium roseum]